MSIHFSIAVLALLLSLAGFGFQPIIEFPERDWYLVATDQHLYTVNNGGAHTKKRVESLAHIQFITIAGGNIGQEKSKRHFLALDTNGKVWAWGNNDHGQLGLGVMGEGTDPTQIPELHNIVGIAAGENISLAWDQDGRLWTFGEAYSQLGTQQFSPSPLSISGVINAGVGSRYILVLDNQGKVWVWGENNNDMFGFGNSEEVALPTQIPHLADITDMSVVPYYSRNYEPQRDPSGAVFLDRENNVWIMGYNHRGEPSEPIRSIENLKAKKIFAAFHHWVALTTEGKPVVCKTTNGCTQNGSGHWSYHYPDLFPCTSIIGPNDSDIYFECDGKIRHFTRNPVEALSDMIVRYNHQSTKSARKKGKRG